LLLFKVPRRLLLLFKVPKIFSLLYEERGARRDGLVRASARLTSRRHNHHSWLISPYKPLAPHQEAPTSLLLLLINSSLEQEEKRWWSSQPWWRSIIMVNHRHHSKPAS
jgi:hypothetical protein